jgi:uncharacterized protein (DUF433 family)
MNWQNYIVSDKKVLLGKPVVKGTRLSVDFIISLYAQGWSEETILQNYPALKQEDLLAIFAFIYDNLQDGLFLFKSGKTG